MNGIRRERGNDKERGWEGKGKGLGEENGRGRMRGNEEERRGGGKGFTGKRKKIYILYIKGRGR